MKTVSVIIIALIVATGGHAQVESGAGSWKTWFISSGEAYRLSSPPSHRDEIREVIAAQKKVDSSVMRRIVYWDAGGPGYRWQEMIQKLWIVDTGRYGILANLLLGTATYDAMVAAWSSKYAHNRPRPFQADKSVRRLVPDPESPSYPCEFSVAAGVAVIVFGKFYPHLADSVTRMATQLMDSRVVAGAAFPSDVRDGFELGKRIAEKEIELTKDFVSTAGWDGKTPDKPGLWRGKFAMFPSAGSNKTVVLTSGSEFRPGPPPDFAKEMEELKNYKQTFRSLSNAFYWANSSWFSDYLPKKLFETGLHRNPPQAARIHAAAAVAAYDAFVACWDAKYTYWGIRPSQYDTTFKPAILVTPPFPGYPSGHAAISAVMAEVYKYFFPEDRELFARKAKEAAESRFQAGIHFRSDNEVALELGKKIGEKVVKVLTSATR
ncbi:MAG TPA: hypothetical protein VEB63_09415 [Chitinophagaceae bacterium]|nr:hypothetical protein [Chitinophagaceae bacterium]